jgi:Biotin-requiring enzyme
VLLISWLYTSSLSYNTLQFIQKAGAAYAEIEVMKMFMPVTVKESGTIHWCISEGATLKPGDKLAILQLDDPSAVTKVCMLSYMYKLP